LGRLLSPVFFHQQHFLLHGGFFFVLGLQLLLLPANVCVRRGCRQSVEVGSSCGLLLHLNIPLSVRLLLLGSLILLGIAICALSFCWWGLLLVLSVLILLLPLVIWLLLRIVLLCEHISLKVLHQFSLVGTLLAGFASAGDLRWIHHQILV
jgi:hypothetical protein